MISVPVVIVSHCPRWILAYVSSMAKEIKHKREHVPSKETKKVTANKNNTVFATILMHIALLAGVFLSFYALYVEYKATLDSSYVAVCDISAKISCSKVFLSEHGKIFSFLGLIPKHSVLDQPNSLYGIAFYAFYGILYKFFSQSQVIRDFLLFLSVLALVLSAYLSYILTAVLHDICVVCYSTYLVNIILFALSVRASYVKQ